ncbi:MAG: hypothetical protein KatS3mg108_3433 [Isosphaeraceae bacterium]|jgi:hypothetical protein|nr:MAG: hypothetical protein KatS3mg108_3433 [Isosphaeraceae bacterium]
MNRPDDVIEPSEKGPSPIARGRVWAVRAGLIGLMLGALLILGTIVEFALHFGDFHDFEARGQRLALQFVAGFVLIVAGQLSVWLGGTGLASALWHLDPQRVAGPLSGWARLSGRLTDEAFSQMKTVRETFKNASLDADVPTEPVTLVRCRSCQSLNDETDQFCGKCGARM